MYSFFVGCDMSKDFFDVAFYDGKRPVYLGQYDNNIEGFEQAIDLLKEKTDLSASSWFVCFENTGVYSKALLEWLISQGIPCREENPLKISKSLGLRRGKNDKIDAQDICTYVYEKRDSIETSSLPKELIVKLKMLLSRRDLLVKQKVALEVSLKEQKVALAPDFYETLAKGNDQLIQTYKEGIAQINFMIEEVIGEDPHAKINHQLAQSVVGIGKVTSAFIIAFTQNYSSFTDPRKFACYSGIAPFSNQSGKRKGKTKVSPMANKRIKSLLSNGVIAAIQHDPQIKLYFQRKRAEGKEYGVVVNAIKNKLVQRVFSVINRQSPYVKLNAYA